MVREEMPLTGGTLGRSRFVLALIAGAMSALLATAAGAVSKVELVFTELNGSPIAPTADLAVLPGDLVRVETVITTGDVGTRGFDIFLDYDSAGDGRVALDHAENIQPPDPAPGYSWITQFDPGTERPGQLRYSSILVLLDTNPPSEVVDGLLNSTYAIGWADLTVTDAILDGPATLFPIADYIIGLTFDDVSGQYEEVDATASFAFSGLTLTLVPEPSTGLLVSLGLLVFGAGNRRRAR